MIESKRRWVRDQLNTMAGLHIRDNRRSCLLYTSDAADERSSVDLGGRRIIKKKKDPSMRTARSERHKKQNAEQSKTK